MIHHGYGLYSQSPRNRANNSVRCRDELPNTASAKPFPLHLTGPVSLKSGHCIVYPRGPGPVGRVPVALLVIGGSTDQPDADDNSSKCNQEGNRRRGGLVSANMYEIQTSNVFLSIPLGAGVAVFVLPHTLCPSFSPLPSPISLAAPPLTWALPSSLLSTSFS